jgi:DNA-binding response OmpR family regulator
MDGLSLARWIHQRRFAPPVLLTSGRGIARSIGGKPADNFIAKPYRLAALKARIESMLASRHLPADETSKPKPQPR